jgi:hypothetical protein
MTEHHAGPHPESKTGDKGEAPQGLWAWHCTLEPRRHVEVAHWGVRPLKGCTVKGCRGIMVHWGRVRTLAPDPLRNRKDQHAKKVVYRSGYVCIENAAHFEPDVKS